MARYTARSLTDLAIKVFEVCGATSDEARCVAEILVESNLMGFDSHGIVRIPWYVELVRSGKIIPGGEFSVISKNGGTAVVDCGYNYGQVGASKAMEVAIDLANDNGISCVVTRRCSHVGRLGTYTTYAANAGMLGLGFCNSPIEGHFVVPFGGSEGRLATNPLSYAAPSNGDPVVLDMSTSSISEGEIRVYRNCGEQLPTERILDGIGRPSTEPNDFYGPPRGSIVPFGGSAGYKATGLALAVEILAGTLSGNLITDDSLTGNGICFIVINVSKLLPEDHFKHLTGELVNYIKSCPSGEGSDEVFVPGEIEFANKRRLEVEGITIDETTWNHIVECVSSLGISAEEVVSKT